LIQRPSARHTSQQPEATAATAVRSIRRKDKTTTRKAKTQASIIYYSTAQHIINKMAEESTTEAPKRHTGVVAKWLNHRGIGFITPDGQESEVGKDLLVHHANIKQGDGNSFKSLARASKVEYETAPDPKHPDKQIATNVTGVGGGDCEKETRRYRNNGGARRSGGRNGKKNGNKAEGGGEGAAAAAPAPAPAAEAKAE
jgi:cold shock CspA family protein